MRRVLVLALVFGALAWPAGAPAAATPQELTFTASDGAKLACALFEPAGAPPAAGWPAVMLFHGLGGKRQDMNQIAEQSFANEGYAVLTFDARGHAQSGGLFASDNSAAKQDLFRAPDPDQPGQ